MQLQNAFDHIVKLTGGAARPTTWIHSNEAAKIQIFRIFLLHGLVNTVATVHTADWSLIIEKWKLGGKI